MGQDDVRQIAEAVCRERDWGIPRVVGSGNSGVVFEIMHPEHGPVALKVYDPSFFVGENAAIEISRLKLLDRIWLHGNEHIIETIEAGALPDHATWYVLMELCPWPTLDRQISALPNNRVESLLHQLVRAVLFLNEGRLVHRDIKPANIALAPDFVTLKLLDLGVLRRTDPLDGNGTDVDATKKRFVATAQDSPPEYLIRQEPTGVRGYDALNIYQVGAVLHDMLMHRPLFGEEAASLNRYILYEAVKSKRPIVSNPAVSPRLVALCRGALEKDPERRLACVTLSDFLVPNEDKNALRRRLAARPDSAPLRPQISVEVWKRRVWDWLADASTQERATIGPFRREVLDAPAGSVRWRLFFPECRLGLRCDLERSQGSGSLILTLSIETPTEVRVPALDIYEEGPAIIDSEVVDQLAQQILYMLGLMQQPVDDGTEGTHE